MADAASTTPLPPVPTAPMASGIPSNANEGCVGPAAEEAGKAAGCAGCPNKTACASGKGREVDPAVAEVAERLSSVKHIVLVLSGKGGVGKSTVSCQLAFSLAAQGKQVGLLDIDICGPSVPRMLGLTGREVHQSSSGWSPVWVTDGLGVMSIGFMLPQQDNAVIWRGPKKNGLIKQFLTDVDWGQLDYLVIDTPPGTSDEHMSVVKYLGGCNVDGAVVVTTPQEVAMADVRKELSFCRKTGLNVLGVVENMSGLTVPVSELLFVDRATGEDKTESARAVLREKAPELLELMAQTTVFTSFGKGPRGMAESYGVPFLGSIPMDPNLLKACEEGEAFTTMYAESPAAKPFVKIVGAVVDATPDASD
ncbi:unnamed protein product [Ectocarpus sp. 8 AP-2014]